MPTRSEQRSVTASARSSSQWRSTAPHAHGDRRGPGAAAAGRWRSGEAPEDLRDEPGTSRSSATTTGSMAPAGAVAIRLPGDARAAFEAYQAARGRVSRAAAGGPVTRGRQDRGGSSCSITTARAARGSGCCASAARGSCSSTCRCTSTSPGRAPDEPRTEQAVVEDAASHGAATTAEQLTRRPAMAGDRAVRTCSFAALRRSHTRSARR